MLWLPVRTVMAWGWIHWVRINADHSAWLFLKTKLIIKPVSYTLKFVTVRRKLVCGMHFNMLTANVRILNNMRNTLKYGGTKEKGVTLVSWLPSPHSIYMLVAKPAQYQIADCHVRILIIYWLPQISVNQKPDLHWKGYVKLETPVPVRSLKLSNLGQTPEAKKK